MVTWSTNPQHVAENVSHMEGFFLLDPIPQSLCKSNVASYVPLKTLAFDIITPPPPPFRISIAISGSS